MISQELKETGLRSTGNIGLGLGTYNFFSDFCWLGQFGRIM